MKKVTLTLFIFAFACMISFGQNTSQMIVNSKAQFVPKEFNDNFCLVETRCSTLKQSNVLAAKINEAGGRIAVVGSPGFMTGWIPENVRVLLTDMKDVVAVHSSVKHEFSTALNPDDNAVVNYFNSVVSGEIINKNLDDNSEFSDPHNFPSGGCMKIQEKSTERSFCERDKNSEYLKGSVSCGIFFVESNGGFDPNTYTWTTTNINNLKAQMLDAFSIWSYTASQNSASVSFTPVWYEAPNTVILQPYEPISHPSTDDGLWISSILANLGYNNGDKFIDTHAYNWDLKNTNGTNWAYSAFVINNPSPAPQLFTNGAPAYAYKGGPYCMLMLRAAGWAISTFYRTFAHESGHIFNAFDEYSTSPPDNCTRAFNGAVNINYQGSPCNGTTACIMINNTFTGTGSTRKWNMCAPTKTHIGWGNLPPVPTQLSPVNNASINPGTVTFSWNRNTTNSAINSLIRVSDTLNNNYDCSVMGPASNAVIFLPVGVYKWEVINGTDAFDGGYAEISSGENNLYVGVNGISETAEVLPAKIYPNPATNQITISNLPSGENEVEIYDLPGQRILFTQTKHVSDKSCTVNVSELSKGMYFVHIRNENREKVVKLFID